MQDDCNDGYGCRFNRAQRLTPVTPCPRLSSPIVLAHGLFGFERIGLGPVTLAVYFRGIPEFLRSSGNRVLVTRVPSIAGVERRAARLAEWIDLTFGDEPVHIIGHSMGGLDARVLLTDPNRRNRVLSLTTIGTPHLGSRLPICARRMELFYAALGKIGVDHSGFLDVTRQVALLRHKRLGTPVGLPCFSVAGDPAIEDVLAPLRGVYELLADREGANDGLVSVASANAFGAPLPTRPIDHLRQMNWFVDSPPLAERIQRLYSDVLSHLAEHGHDAERRESVASTGLTTAADIRVGTFFEDETMI